MVSDVQTAMPNEVVVMITLQFKAGLAQTVIERMVPSICLTREEPGNKEFQLFKVGAAEDRYVVLERWKDQAALERHWKQPYTIEILALFQEHLEKPLSEVDDVVYLTDMMAISDRTAV